jgi:hypothetical protein
MLISLIGISCGDGDDSTEPGLDVSGVWRFVGVLTQNACDLDTFLSLSGDISFTQVGSSVSTPVVYLSIIRNGSDWFFTYAGTLTGNDISMAAVDPYVLQSGGVVIHYGSGIDIQDIENNSGTGSLNITGSCIQGCTGSCQTIWTGTWEKQG